MNREIQLFIKKYFQEYSLKHIILYAPYTWLLLFLLVPFLIIFKISFTQSILALPPISEIINVIDGDLVQISLSIKNYITIFTDPFYIDALSSSIYLACLATLISLIIGYVIAYGIYRQPHEYHYILLMLIMIPFWTSFLVRVYAWMNLLNTKGIVNQLLMHLNFIEKPLQLLNTPGAVCFGLVYCYLPFMILPIYTALEKIDSSYSEAAFDLGASPWQVFWRIIVPLSYSGIVAGCVLVFMPSIGEFVIPELLGGPQTFTIGRALWLEFFNNRNWPLACALAILMILPIILVMMIASSIQKKRQSFTI